MRCGICGFPNATICGCARAMQRNSDFSDWRDAFKKQDEMRRREAEYELMRRSLAQLTQQQMTALRPSDMMLGAYPAPPPALPTADTMGPIRAWRLWRIKGERLWSVAHGMEWRPGVPMQGQPAPHDQAGVYAVKDRAYPFHAYDGDTILGEVGLWGRVIEHEHGFRAEYAYPIRLVWRAPTTMPGFPRPVGALRRLQALADEYGIPLTVEEPT